MSSLNFDEESDKENSDENPGPEKGQGGQILEVVKALHRNEKETSQSETRPSMSGLMQDSRGTIDKLLNKVETRKEQERQRKQKGATKSDKDRENISKIRKELKELENRGIDSVVTRARKLATDSTTVASTGTLEPSTTTTTPSAQLTSQIATQHVSPLETKTEKTSEQSSGEKGVVSGDAKMAVDTTQGVEEGEGEGDLDECWETVAEQNMDAENEGGGDVKQPENEAMISQQPKKLVIDLEEEEEAEAEDPKIENENEKSKKGRKKKSAGQKAMEKKEKEDALELHKASVLLLTASCAQQNTLCNDQLLQSIIFSCLPSDLHLSDSSQLSLDQLTSITKWFTDHFFGQGKMEAVGNEGSEGLMDAESLVGAIMEQKKLNEHEAAIVFVALCRALKLRSRLVTRLSPTPVKPQTLDVPATTSSNQPKKPTADSGSASQVPSKSKGKKRDHVGEFIQKTFGIARNEVENQDSVELENPPPPPPTVTLTLTETSSAAREKSAESENMKDSETKKRTKENESEKSKTTKGKKKSGKKGKGVVERLDSSDGDADFVEEEEVEKPKKRQKRAAAAATQATVKLSQPSAAEVPTATVTTQQQHEQEQQAVLKERRVWAEVFSPSLCRWIHVDCLSGIVDDPSRLVFTQEPLSYILGFDDDGACRDVTPRYAQDWSVVESSRAPAEWWFLTVSQFAKPPLTQLDQEAEMIEDVEFESKKQLDDLPKTFSEFKYSKTYVVEQFLTRYQAVYPRAPIRTFQHAKDGPIPVYPRSNVHLLHTKERWVKEGRQVKEGEAPYKTIKAVQTTAAITPEDNLKTTELFGRWQTEPYVPPKAKDGKVPKNERGNVDVWSADSLPQGTVHVKLPRIATVAKKLGIDFAPALVGFETRGGRNVPVMDGIVVCEEFEQILVDAYTETERERLSKLETKREKVILDRWARLVRGIFMRRRVQRLFAEGNSYREQHQKKQETSGGRLRKTVPTNVMQIEEGAEANDENENDSQMS